MEQPIKLMIAPTLGADAVAGSLADLVRVLAGLAAGGHSIRLQLDVDGSRVQLAVNPQQGVDVDKPLTACETDICALLAGVGQRMTTDRVKDELDRLARDKKIELHGESTINHALANLVRRKGKLDNRTDSCGKGYGLAEWSGNGRPAATVQRHPADRPDHSADFRSVRWFGADYLFTATQAAVVRQLWQAWEDGTPDVGQETLAEGAGSERGRLRDVFRGHPAWQAFIGSKSKGTFRLLESLKT